MYIFNTEKVFQRFLIKVRIFLLILNNRLASYADIFALDANDL